MKKVLVVGATGDVGRGVVQAVIDKGWQVIAAGRSQNKLDQMSAEYSNKQLATIIGDLASEQGAEKLWHAASDCFDGIDAVVVTVNAPNAYKALLDRTSAELLSIYDANVMTHYNAAKVFTSRLAENGVFIGIGGGMADLVVPKMGELSMAQAALRAMYRYIASEVGGGGPAVKELMIISMVNGASTREKADSSWLTDVEVGTHIAAILTNPTLFPEPILKLKSRKQIGLPTVESKS